jgi:hypothetical protein
MGSGLPWGFASMLIGRVSLILGENKKERSADIFRPAGLLLREAVGVVASG